MEYHDKAYVCIHVYERTRPTLLVARNDGDWSFLCGAEHEQDPDLFRVVGIGHLLEADPSLRGILDLTEGWEAERAAVGKPWRRKRCGDA